jgi:hypothetical protein
MVTHPVALYNLSEDSSIRDSREINCLLMPGVTVRDLFDMAAGMEDTDEDVGAYTNPANRICQT